MPRMVHSATVRATVRAAGFAALLMLTACQSSPSPTPSTTVAVVAGSCHVGSDSGQPLPDPRCTPGALNPAVTQATIGSTICKAGWTRTIRPPVSYTERLKRQGIAAYGYADKRLSAYEEDHLVPLEIGGNPTSPLNLWPQRGASPNKKDAVESAGRDAVCSGKMALSAAQSGIAADWVQFGRSLGVL